MTPPRFLPLGDQAVMAYCANEAEALVFARAVQAISLDWLIEVVPAYTSVAVYYDLARVEYTVAAEQLAFVFPKIEEQASTLGRLHRIPCCYELGLDAERVAEHAGLSPAEVTRLHAATIYTVYAIGFCPGFPYLGYLPRELEGVPRLDTPRLRVEAGSVGLAGRQTGIYTEPRPGGWNLIGRTPLTLVDVADEYFPLRPGDQVQFFAIERQDFARLAGRQLSNTKMP